MLVSILISLAKERVIDEGDDDDWSLRIIFINSKCKYCFFQYIYIEIYT